MCTEKKQKEENWYRISVELPKPYIRPFRWNCLFSLLYVILLVALVCIYIFNVVPEFLCFYKRYSYHASHIWIFIIVSAVIAWTVFLLCKLLFFKTSLYAEELKATMALRRKLIEESQHREILIQELQIKKEYNLEKNNK